MPSATEILSSQNWQIGLLYARELVGKLSINSLLIIGSTTKSLVDREVRAISTRDI